MICAARFCRAKCVDESVACWRGPSLWPMAARRKQECQAHHRPPLIGSKETQVLLRAAMRAVPIEPHSQLTYSGQGHGRLMQRCLHKPPQQGRTERLWWLRRCICKGRKRAMIAEAGGLESHAPSTQTRKHTSCIQGDKYVAQLPQSASPPRPARGHHALHGHGGAARWPAR